ncbi:MAG: ATP-dependent RNA helicase HrpA, partial [bacterium]
IKDGYRTLEEVTAVDGIRKVTKLGRQLARLPVDPRIGRMLLEAAHTGCLTELLVITAFLSVQDPRDRPIDKQQAADEAHAIFKDEASDFTAMTNLWNYLEEKRKHLTRRKFNRLCHQHFLSISRVQEWRDIHRQLQVQMHELGYRNNEKPASLEVIHCAVLSGLLSHIGLKQSGKDKQYQGARNSRFHLFPGSGLFTAQPKWVVAAELVETTRLYARGVAQIQPQWVERLAGHLLKRRYAEAHWQSRRGQVGAYETVTLYGIPLATRRRVNYGPVNPEESRELFIRHGLVAGDFDTRAKFWRHNQELIEEVHDMEARSRRRDILVDEEVIYGFYDQQIPAGIYSKPDFEKWLRKASQKNPRLLFLDRKTIIRSDAKMVDEEAFPAALLVEGLKLPLRYQFDPDRADDGVTMLIPGAVMNQVPAWAGDWLVPGLLREKVIALIKGLPKAIRRSFVPVPDYADKFITGSAKQDSPLIQVLGKALKQWSGTHIAEDLWPVQDLPAHLQMNYALLDSEGNCIDQSRDLVALQQKYTGHDFGSSGVESSTGLTEEPMRDFDIVSLPESVEINSAGMKLKAWPAMVDRGDSVVIEALDSAQNARIAHHKGLRRLVRLRLPQLLKGLRKDIAPRVQALQLKYAKAPGKSQGHQNLESTLIDFIIDRTFFDNNGEIRDASNFNRCLEAGRSNLFEVSNSTLDLVEDILAQYQRVRSMLSKLNQINWLHSVSDMQDQLDGLVYQGFLSEVAMEHLQHYPRYLQALGKRIESLRSAAARDQQRMQEMKAVLERWKQRYAVNSQDPRLEEIRWMLEELRVSLFAQELKTPFPVSVKRLDKRWQALGL